MPSHRRLTQPPSSGAGAGPAAADAPKAKPAPSLPNHPQQQQQQQQRGPDEDDMEGLEEETASSEGEETAGSEEEPVGAAAAAEEEAMPTAVPFGAPFKVTGTGSEEEEKHYASFYRNDEIIELEDAVMFQPEEWCTEKPRVGIIKDIIGKDGWLSLTGQWLYRPEEADKEDGGKWESSNIRELFYSFRTDVVSAELVMHKCVVHFIPNNKQIPNRKEHPGFVVQKVYDTVEKKLRSLTDNDYPDKKKHEIALLVDKTVARVGMLLDLEPANTDQFSNKQGSRKRSAHPLDVSRDDSQTGNSEQFIKAETPGSDSLKYNDILMTYKAVTGDQYRDRWLDKFLDIIPIASNESARVSHADPDNAAKSSTNDSCTKDTSSDDNEKSYAPGVVVSIMASLERCTYEALGSDFQKYNQKLRQLWFNIKNTATLRKRLMDRELDPPGLLTMSPDELKAGLTAPEKTYEAEESRQLQMTGARCKRCTEKKVGISDIIKAGHGDRYQLECMSCGHTWFSSRDAILSLTVDVPITDGSVGTAPWATAKFDVLEKQLASPRDNPDKQRTDALQKTKAALPTPQKQKLFSKPKSEEPLTLIGSRPAAAANHDY